MDRPIILCGFGRMGARVLSYLRAADLPVVVIDSVARPEDARLSGVPLIQGDCRRRDVLERAGVAGARGVLILTNDDLLNVTTALTVRSLDREVRIVLRMFNQNLLARLGRSVHNVFALSTSLLTAPIVALTALTGQGLGTYRLDDSRDGLRQLVDLPITATSPLRGQAVGTVASQHGLVAVAHMPAHSEDRYLLAVDPDRVLEAGDHLVLQGSPDQLAPLVNQGSDEDKLRMGGWFRRTARMVWRTLAEMDRAVLICASVLVVFVVVSTCVLHLGVTRYSIPDAFLRSVSIMATSAGFHEDEYPDAPGIRIFVSFLRILGAVLMAAFTAIVTNYLLRARLGGALEVRRIPERGHLVVVGLSTVGFRVVEELSRMGERVVVIDSDATNRFISTARRLGAAVMVGDASVIEVLRQAHAGQARAVVSATNNDMVNLEVSLLVRELDPEGRVVVLINDPQFAQMLRDAADIRLAVSVPALAAPAFVAGLFGDRVVSVVLLREHMFAILDLIIAEQDLLIGKPIRAVAVDYNFLPLSLVRTGALPPRSLLAGRIELGDRLVGIIALEDLERLLRRQPSSANWAVHVTGFPIPQRGWLAGIIRMHSEVSIEEADRIVENLPFRLATSLTRGQAEDLLAQLHRERITAKLAPADSPLGDNPVLS